MEDYFLLRQTLKVQQVGQSWNDALLRQVVRPQVVRSSRRRDLEGKQARGQREEIEGDALAGEEEVLKSQ